MPEQLLGRAKEEWRNSLPFEALAQNDIVAVYFVTDQELLEKLDDSSTTYAGSRGLLEPLGAADKEPGWIIVESKEGDGGSSPVYYWAVDRSGDGVSFGADVDSAHTYQCMTAADIEG